MRAFVLISTLFVLAAARPDVSHLGYAYNNPASSQTVTTVETVPSHSYELPVQTSHGSTAPAVNFVSYSTPTTGTSGASTVQRVQTVQPVRTFQTVQQVQPVRTVQTFQTTPVVSTTRFGGVSDGFGSGTIPSQIFTVGTTSDGFGSGTFSDGGFSSGGVTQGFSGTGSRGTFGGGYRDVGGAQSGFGGVGVSHGGFGGAGVGQGGFSGAGFGQGGFGGAGVGHGGFGGTGGGVNVIRKSTVVHAQPPIITKKAYVFAAPEDHEEEFKQQIVVPRGRKHYNIVFIKAPATTTYIAPTGAITPQNQEKTIIYVLSNKKRIENVIKYEGIDEQKPKHPEVYFIKYKSPTKRTETQVTYDLSHAKSDGLTGLGDIDLSSLHSRFGGDGGDGGADGATVSFISGGDNGGVSGQGLVGHGVGGSTGFGGATGGGGVTFVSSAQPTVDTGFSTSSGGGTGGGVTFVSSAHPTVDTGFSTSSGGGTGGGVTFVSSAHPTVDTGFSTGLSGSSGDVSFVSSAPTIATGFETIHTSAPEVQSFVTETVTATPVTYVSTPQVVSTVHTAPAATLTTFGAPTQTSGVTFGIRGSYDDDAASSAVSKTISAADKLTYGPPGFGTI